MSAPLSYIHRAVAVSPARCALSPSASGAVHAPDSATARNLPAAFAHSRLAPVSPDASMMPAWYIQLTWFIRAHRSKCSCAAVTFLSAPRPARSISPALTEPSPFPKSAARRKYDNAVVSFLGTLSP